MESWQRTESLHKFATKEICGREAACGCPNLQLNVLIAGVSLSFLQQEAEGLLQEQNCSALSITYSILFIYFKWFSTSL